ncbi:unnamed protein product [Anisakis simplex]|uniref:Ground-like domain-containing protein n=1 Tax=Anisakis simplex TaxID=6269 RepID=A0A0M3K4D6_ANISI|nr:unnamed protein product [Anisakis simplex]
MPSQCVRRFHHHRRNKRSEEEGTAIGEVVKMLEGEEITCNSEKLKNIMLQEITNDTSVAKRNIQRAAEKILKEDFNVICAEGPFSYVSHTDTYCQITKPSVTCYAFKAY